MNEFIRFFMSVFMAMVILFSSFSVAEKDNMSEYVKQGMDTVQINQYGEGYRYNIQGWVYVRIKGEPYERGYQYGYLLAEEIVDLMTRWSNMIHNHPRIKPFNGLFSQARYEKISEIWWNFCKSRCARIYWNKYPNEYKEEIVGIADGLNDRGKKLHGETITYEDVLTSNEMYEFLSKLTYKGLVKGIHPLRTLLKKLKEETPALTKVKANNFIQDFFNSAIHHKCNGFIATGDATTNGQIVISNSMWSTTTGIAWWWSYYITFRWNIILDINPTNGNRFIMVCAPGYIWSDHDFYQNEVGIVFLETTCPQGLWDNIGLPLAVRARKAIQYGNNIDEVMYYLKHRNDGIMNAVWLIGDTKTGEIARFELGYKHSWVNRTLNGFHWSANNPMNLRVRLEKLHWRDILKDFMLSLFGYDGYKYSFPRYRPTDRDIKFNELGNKYYGKIDADIVKEIMSTYPMSPWSPDCKLTTSDLVQKNGLWVFMGSLEGKVIEVENLDNSKLEVKKIGPDGWVRVYGLPYEKGCEVSNQPMGQNSQVEIDWTYNTSDDRNDFHSSCIVNDDVLFSTTSAGEIIALNSGDGSLLWNKTIGVHPTAPTLHGNNLFVGTAEGLKMIDLNWMTMGEKKLGKIVSKPVVADNNIYVGNEDGDVYAFDIPSGVELWHAHLPDEVYLSEVWNGSTFVVSGKTCYAINVETGSELWNFTTSGMITSRPYVNDGIVYFGSWDTYVYAIDANNGDLLWRYETGWGVDTTPVISDGLLFVGSHDNNFYALDKNTGELEWLFSCNAGIHVSPVVDENNVVFGSDDGRLYILNKATGDIVGTFSPGFTICDKINYLTTPILSNPALESNTLFMGAKGKIFALSLV